MSDVADFVGDTWDDLTGKSAAEAAQTASSQQVAAGERALEAIRGDLAPFRTDIGEQVMPRLIDYVLSDSPSMGDVMSNPMFQGLSQYASSNILNNAALSGKLGTGDTLLDLQNAIVPLGMQFHQQQMADRGQRFGELFNLGTLGANSAAQTGTQTANIMQGIGNAQAAGTVGAANARNQFSQMLMGAGLGAAGGAAGLFGGGISAGGGALLGMLSDERAKEDIEEVGDIKGVKIYTYKYKGDDKTQMGVLAQEVEKQVPGAVTEKDGIKYVNYQILGEKLNAA